MYISLTQKRQRASKIWSLRTNFYFTDASWFSGNVQLKPHSNTQYPPGFGCIRSNSLKSPSISLCPPPPDFQTFLRSCTVLLSFLLLRYIVSGSDLFAGHALCLWGEKLGAILAKQRSNQVTTHILLPSLLASITGGQIPCRSVSLRIRLLQYCQLTLKSNRNLVLKRKTKTKPKATSPKTKAKVRQQYWSR